MGLFDQGPGYTVKDLVFWIGLFTGLIVTYLVMEAFEIHRIVRLLVGLVVGLGVGWVLTKAFEFGKVPPDREPEDREE